MVTKKLDGPFGLQKAVGHRGFVVAENVSGQLTRVFRDGRQRVLVRRIGGVAGVAADAHHVYAVTGGPNEQGQSPGGDFKSSSLVRTDYQGKHTKVIADLLKYELTHNPDGQVQFVDGKPVDSLSNPFSMTMSQWGLLVADGGANDVLKVNPRTGRVSTFFAPPTVKDVKACQGPDANANPGTRGLRPGPDRRGRGARQGLRQHARRRGARCGTHLQAEPQRQGAAGLEGPHGADRRRGPADGTIYASQVLEGAPTRHSRRPGSTRPRWARSPGSGQPPHARAGDHADRPGPEERCPLRLGVEHRELPRHPARRPGREGARGSLPLTHCAEHDEAPPGPRPGGASGGVSDGT